jgi:uncharacterized membrane protein YdbT with pleckstrin-like domain
MINSWLLASLITVTLLVIAIVWRITPEQWLVAGGLAGLMWLGLLLTLLVRKLNVSYELTDQRLIHKVGILRRTTDRIEVIDMDDISYDQSIFERLLGVGSIRVTSSDQTHPKFVLRGIDDVQHVASTMDEARRQERVKRGLHIEAV